MGGDFFTPSRLSLTSITSLTSPRALRRSLGSLAFLRTPSSLTPLDSPRSMNSLTSLNSVDSRESSEVALASDVDLTGKVAFIAGIADASGYGWAIARRLAAAGCKIAVGTWPPVLGIFTKALESGKFDEQRKLGDGRMMEIENVYALDALYDTPDSVPEEVASNKRYAGLQGYTISEVAQQLAADYGQIDILVHSLANGPEVTKPLLQTSRSGYLSAISSSSYSLTSLVQHMGPLLTPYRGAVVSLTYDASQRVVPGYGGGMSSAKAAMESDTRVLAYEAGVKWGLRVNTISAGPLKSRAASAIGKVGDKSFIDYAIDYSQNNAPLKQELLASDVASTALFLLSPMSRSVTGSVVYVDGGLHAMGVALDSPSWATSK
eukprot:GHVN01105001.1.p1 GENE.GHVN01105001.1~~GHVN01105001.1.p1  ORF type:complete len:427 (+),score=111.83 GHVN01105001.1:148-1281(+)